MHWLNVKERFIYEILVILRKYTAVCVPQTLNKLFQLSRGDRLCERDSSADRVWRESLLSLGPEALKSFFSQTIRAEPDVEKYKKSLKTFVLYH